MSDFLQIVRASLDKFMAEYAEHLPDLGKAKTLLCFSDYSGEEKQANYYCYSFLIIDGDNIASWDMLRLSLRKIMLPDGRRISFKNYRDKMSENFIGQYLKLADKLPGYLISFAVEKNIKSIFEKGNFDNPEFKEYEKWTNDTLEKAFRVTHMLSALIAKLSSAGQNIIWITDEDKISANKERLTQLTKLFALTVPSYLSHNLGHMRVGTTSSDDGTRLIEDLCAIPDLAAGVYSDQLKQSKMDFSNSVPPIFWLNAPGFQEKTNNISWWLATAQNNLCKLFFRLDYSNEDKGDVHFYKFFSPEKGKSNQM